MTTGRINQVTIVQRPRGGSESVKRRGVRRSNRRAPGRPRVIESNRVTRRAGHPIATSEFFKERVRRRRRPGRGRTWAYRPQMEAPRRQSRPKAATGSRTFPRLLRFSNVCQRPTTHRLPPCGVTLIKRRRLRASPNRHTQGSARSANGRGAGKGRKCSSRPPPSRQRDGSIGRRGNVIRLC